MFLRNILKHSTTSLSPFIISILDKETLTFYILKIDAMSAFYLKMTTKMTTLNNTDQ